MDGFLRTPPRRGRLTYSSSRLKNRFRFHPGLQAFKSGPGFWKPPNLYSSKGNEESMLYNILGGRADYQTMRECEKGTNIMDVSVLLQGREVEGVVREGRSTRENCF